MSESRTYVLFIQAAICMCVDESLRCGHEHHLRYCLSVGANVERHGVW